MDLQTSCSGCEYIMKLEGMRTAGGGHGLSAVSVSLSLTGCAAFAEENREEQLWVGMFKTAAGFSLHGAG